MKSKFEWQGKKYKTFWNEKTYGDTKYITTTAPSGGETKVTASVSKGLSASGSHSLDFAKAAYKSITGQDW